MSPHKKLTETARFINQSLINSDGLYSSVPSGRRTLYGTCYSVLTLNYLDNTYEPSNSTRTFIQSCQMPSGEFIGPELLNFFPSHQDKHDREHLIFHLTCLALATCIQFNIPVPYKLTFIYPFCDLIYLNQWLTKRDFSDAWFEGNNLLFVGELLVYLRDHEEKLDANFSLDYWFSWLDEKIDGKTGLWGTDGLCSKSNAVYGGYHQLLVYYYENHKITNPSSLVDIVLSLQHLDGSFSQSGNGGACEDVDCVDILVNMYKKFDYRRKEIRFALKRCMKHILRMQNSDGGFPYNRNQFQSHMNIPATRADENMSTAFATWFRFHALSLIAQVLPDEYIYEGVSLGFSNSLSMGWHNPWDQSIARQYIGKNEKIEFLIKNSLLRQSQTMIQVKQKMIRSVSRLLRLIRK